MTNETKAVVKAAAVQAAPVFMDLDASVIKAKQLIKEAADQGCDIIGFSECWLPGYPWFIWLNSAASNMRYILDYHKNSPTADGDALKAIAEAARDNNIFVSMGASERDHGTLYISQFLFGPDGELISGRRKLKPTHMERTVYGEGDGSDLEVSSTSIGRVGQLSCWEHLQPLNKYAMFSQHEQIHVAAWPSFSIYPEAHALGAELNNSVSAVYAAEGQCFVLAPCGVISQDMIDMLVETDEHRALIKAGGGHAMIYGPDGAPMCEPLAPDAEGLLIADLPMEAITAAKCFGDPAGHYARPDVTRLMLNRCPQPPAEVFVPEVLPLDSDEPEQVES